MTINYNNNTIELTTAEMKEGSQGLPQEGTENLRGSRSQG